MISAGIDVLQPLEVKAGMDLKELKTIGNNMNSGKLAEINNVLLARC